MRAAAVRGREFLDVTESEVSRTAPAARRAMERDMKHSRRAAARILPAALAAGVLVLACAPANAQLAVTGPGLPSSVTPYDGESLWNIVQNAAIPYPPGFQKNAQLRGYVMAFGGGTESVFSLGELNPAFGGSSATGAFPFISVSGGAYSLVDPLAGASGRDVSNLTQLVIGWVPQPSGTGGGQSSTVTLSGLTKLPGQYDITALQALGSQTINPANGSTYTGVQLSTFVNLSAPDSINSQVVAVTATDGYTVAFSLAELFENPQDTLAYAGTGFPGVGFARAVTPFPDSETGHKLGRWVSNVDFVTVEYASPAPVPGVGLLSLGLLALAGVATRTGGIAAALRRTLGIVRPV